MKGDLFEKTHTYCYSQPVNYLLLCFNRAYSPPPKKLDANGFFGVFVESGPLYISGQPDEGSFSRLNDLGVTTVINLRTQIEMDNKTSVPFDEMKRLTSRV